MICEKCVNLEVFGRKGTDEWFYRCALLDIWNMEEGSECDFFAAVPDPPPPMTVITSEPELTMFF